MNTGKNGLSRRLQAVADLVSPGKRVCDVGCDHGYVSIYLIESGRADAVLAMDVNRGPLERARINVEKHGLTGYITLRLSNGLDAYRTGEAQSLVIAGMGGRLMQSILTKDKEKTEDFEELILQPQSDLDAVRIYLKEQGFCICKEDMIFEDGKYYPILKAVHGENTDDRQIWFLYGRLLLESRHPVLEKYLLKEKKQHEKLLAQLRFTETETGRHRREELAGEDRLIDEALAYYKENM